MSAPHTLAPSDTKDNAPIVLMVDGGPYIGFGHVGRCLAIWEELDGRAEFLAEDPGVLRTLRALGARIAAPDTLTSVALIDRRIPTSAAEVERLQAGGQRVCLLDDPGAGRLLAELVIDPPTGANWPAADGRRLAGFEHALIRRGLRAAAGDPRPGVEVLLSMGGSDPEGLTPVLAQALMEAGASVLTALGPAYRGPIPRGELLDPEQWPRALAGTRLLVGRFGHTLLEAAHLGTPVLAVATNERAAEEAQSFAAYGTADAIRVRGPGDAPAVAERALTLLGDTTRLRAMTARGRELVDGRGAVRVAAALRELA